MADEAEKLTADDIEPLKVVFERHDAFKRYRKRTLRDFFNGKSLSEKQHQYLLMAFLRTISRLSPSSEERKEVAKFYGKMVHTPLDEINTLILT